MDRKVFDCTYTAQNGKTYSYGAESVIAHAVQELPASVVAEALQEYMLEAPHQGWEGFSRQDVSSIRKFLRDFALVLQDVAKRE